MANDKIKHGQLYQTPYVFYTIVYEETLRSIDYAISTAGIPYEGGLDYSIECTLAMEDGSPIADQLTATMHSYIKRAKVSKKYQKVSQNIQLSKNLQVSKN